MEHIALAARKNAYLCFRLFAVKQDGAAEEFGIRPNSLPCLRCLGDVDRGHHNLHERIPLAEV